MFYIHQHKECLKIHFREGISKENVEITVAIYNYSKIMGSIVAYIMTLYTFLNEFKTLKFRKNHLLKTFSEMVLNAYVK